VRTMRSHCLAPHRIAAAPRSGVAALARGLVIAALACGAAAPAWADDPELAEPKPPRRLDREILLELGRPARDDLDWSSFLTDGHFRLKGKGLQYRQKFRYNDRRLVLKLTGPRVEGGYGLHVEIEF